MLIRWRPGFVDDHALILYVYLSNDDGGGDESVLTASVPSHTNQHRGLTNDSTT